MMVNGLTFVFAIASACAWSIHKDLATVNCTIKNVISEKLVFEEPLEVCIQMYHVFLGEEPRKGVTLPSFNQESNIFRVPNIAARRPFVIKLTIVSLSQIYYYSGGQSYSYGAFKDRITASTTPGNASITISNMQPSDTGSYTCEVFSPQGDAGQSQKSVIVSVLGKSLPSLSLYCLFLSVL